MWHGVKVIIAYPTDEALGLEDKGKYSKVRVEKGKQLTTWRQLLDLLSLHKRSSQKAAPNRNTSLTAATTISYCGVSVTKEPAARSNRGRKSTG